MLLLRTTTYQNLPEIMAEGSTVLLSATMISEYLGPISVAVQTLADNNFVGILTGSSEARHQQAARWFLISFSTGGCYYGNTTRFPHEEMSA